MCIKLVDGGVLWNQSRNTLIKRKIYSSSALCNSVPSHFFVVEVLKKTLENDGEYLRKGLVINDSKIMWTLIDPKDVRGFSKPESILDDQD